VIKEANFQEHETQYPITSLLAAFFHCFLPRFCLNATAVANIQTAASNGVLKPKRDDVISAQHDEGLRGTFFLSFATRCFVSMPAASSEEEKAD